MKAETVGQTDEDVTVSAYNIKREEALFAGPPATAAMAIEPTAVTNIETTVQRVPTQSESLGTCHSTPTTKSQAI